MGLEVKKPVKRGGRGCPATCASRQSVRARFLDQRESFIGSTTIPFLNQSLSSLPLLVLPSPF